MINKVLDTEHNEEFLRYYAMRKEKMRVVRFVPGLDMKTNRNGSVRWGREPRELVLFNGSTKAYVRWRRTNDLRDGDVIILYKDGVEQARETIEPEAVSASADKARKRRKRPEGTDVGNN
jgi:hypothetical protein